MKENTSTIGIVGLGSMGGGMARSLVRAGLVTHGFDVDESRVAALCAEGGHGGHNGMRSILQHLGSQKFARLRVGVGRPGGGKKVGPGYVLKPFSKAQAPIMDIARPTATDAVAAFITQGIEYAMNNYNKSVA